MSVRSAIILKVDRRALAVHGVVLGEAACQPARNKLVAGPALCFPDPLEVAAGHEGSHGKAVRIILNEQIVADTLLQVSLDEIAQRGVPRSSGEILSLVERLNSVLLGRHLPAGTNTGAPVP